jgi:ParB family chromosome partitioning protein
MEKKKALGKGLGALLAEPETAIPNNFAHNKKTDVVSIAPQIALSKIETNPFQPRTEFDEQRLIELADSIKLYGVIQPITVRKISPEKYQLISGERRLRASKLAGLAEIPAYIRIADDQAMLELALIENIQREDLDAIEIALSYQRLIEECRLTQEELSGRVSKERSTITNYLRLLKLPAELQLAIKKQMISMGHARALINVTEHQKQLQILNDIIEYDLSVRDVEEIVRSLNNYVSKSKKKKENSKPAPIAGKYQDSLKSLSQILNTKIELKQTSSNKGKIEIPFSSEQELEIIFGRIEQYLAAKN